jgi:hypothetical protein
MLGAGPPVSMYATKTTIGKCSFNINQLKELFTFSVKDRYQLNIVIVSKTSMHRQLLFKIKFVLFLYLLLSASWKKNDPSWYIYVIRQTVGYRTPVFTQPFSWRLHIAITYSLPNISDVMTRKRQNVIGIDKIRNNRIWEVFNKIWR